MRSFDASSKTPFCFERKVVLLRAKRRFTRSKSRICFLCACLFKLRIIMHSRKDGFNHSQIHNSQFIFRAPTIKTCVGSVNIFKYIYNYINKNTRKTEVPLKILIVNCESVNAPFLQTITFYLSGLIAAG